VSLPFIATDRIARQRWGTAWRSEGRPDAPPIVFAGKRNNALRLTALDETAYRAGLSHGQALTDARAMHPDIEVLGEDAAADLLLVEAIAGWCDRYTPLVAVEPADEALSDPAQASAGGGLMLDITGCAHLFGGEKALATDLLARLFHQGFAAAAAIASTPGAAWALARFGGATPVVARAETAAALAPLPLAALRLEGETLSGLARVGLRQVGQVMQRPRGPLARRFGRHLLMRLDQALGEIEEAISPRLPVPDLIAERRLAEPVATCDAVEMLAGRLAGHLCADLERRGQGARVLGLALYRVDGHVLRLEAGTSRPLREAKVIQRLFAERLAALAGDFDAGFGFDMIRLSAQTVEILEGETAQWLGNSADIRPVSDLVDRLDARLGAGRVVTGIACDTHLPERAERLVPMQSAGAVRAESADSAPACLPPLRPLRLFDRPEPVEAIAQVPDGPPVRFRWRRVLHEIARAEGPERIADEWWRRGHERPTRDYFRVEDCEGRRFWLFREGLYGSETAAPRWFLHGLFA
jgi:protein ImuB